MIGTLASLAPPLGQASCGITDPGACYDSAVYTLYEGMAETIWSFDRTLLVLAYQLDQLRWWLVSHAFLSAYAGVRAVAEPLLAPAAMLAMVVGLLLFLLVPLLGRINLINLRQVLVWLLVAPLLLAEAGQWLAGLEGLRSDIGGVVAAQIGVTTSEGLFGAPGSSAEEPIGDPQQRLYPTQGGVSPCAAGLVGRPPALGALPGPAAMRMDDLAAVLLLADAQDLHCPEEAPPDSDLPDRFYGTFAFEGAIDQLESDERAQQIQRIQRGITRLLLGVAACLLAVAETLIQLTFTLSLVVLWLCLPIVAIVVMFSSSLRPLGALVERAVQIVVTGWVVSVVLGLLGACMVGAASGGSAASMVALSLGGLLLAGRLLAAALALLNQTLVGVAALASQSLGATVAGSAGSAMLLTRRAARGTRRVGAQMANAAGAAGRGLMAREAAGGRLRPLAPVGAVAVGMGMDAGAEPARPAQGQMEAREG